MGYAKQGRSGPTGTAPSPTPLPLLIKGSEPQGPTIPCKPSYETNWLKRRDSAPRVARPRAMDTEFHRWLQALTSTVHTNSTRSDFNSHYAGSPMDLYGAVPYPSLDVYCHAFSPFGPWSLSHRSGYTSTSDAAAACRSRAALIGFGIEREKVKKRWLIPHRRSFELMPPIHAFRFALGGDFGGTEGRELEKPQIQDRRRKPILPNLSPPNLLSVGADARLR